MAEKKQHAFKSPQLDWLNNYLGSSDTLKSNPFLQNLVAIPVNQDNENGNLVEHGNSSKPSSHMSHGGSPTGNGTDRQRRLPVGIMITGYDIANIATKTALAPIERVNIMMQCQNEMLKKGCLSTPYKGMTDCLRRIIKHEGVTSLWRGNSMNVISICVREARLSAMYYLPNNMNTKIVEPPLYFLPLCLSNYPVDYARVRLACNIKADKRSKFSLDFSGNNIRKRQFNGVIDVYKKTLQLNGVHGLYRGFSVSGLGIWANYHMGHMFVAGPNKDPITTLDLLIDGYVLFVQPAVFYPFVTVSRRMMMTSGEASKYRGVVDAFCRIVKTEGVSSLYKGLTPYMIHNFLFCYVMLVI